MRQTLQVAVSAVLNYPWKIVLPWSVTRRSIDVDKIWKYPESMDAAGTEKTHKGERKTWVCSHLIPVEFTSLKFLKEIYNTLSY